MAFSQGAAMAAMICALQGNGGEFGLHSLVD